MTALTILMFASAYILGSVSSAIVICRLFRLGDPRLQGSGNPGATNVMRIGGKLPAILVLIFDILKGTVPVWGSYHLGLDPIYLAFVAVFACLGHMLPLFFGFSGGKAVATALGTILPLGLGLAMTLIITWVTVLFVFGYSSLASIVTVLIAPLLTLYFKPEYALPVGILCLLIIIRHKHNLLRLLFRQEIKVWERKK